ncbi:DNA polymerase theta-like isoform X1 [Selaginella moellendorffii]|uniref:DNA polymerase theta-like isoform X1 n=1 Tax=Selaginella moellendorffii TaxID=88036 RepID=UPI000D1CE032|nr:DNA polymerase theta-like isoform X1 [Selaginella moellendorffii]|eukprot:XP_024540932.1 DNA polymerase theta-like isoform X1 [Selaginella moellendorffii]
MFCKRRARRWTSLQSKALRDEMAIPLGATTAEMVEVADRKLPPFQHSAKKLPCTPHASAGNGGDPTPNWLLDKKYVSPGDSFWDEAIRVLGSKKGDSSEVKSRINPDGPNLLNSPLPVVCFDFASHDNVGKEAAAAPTEEGKAIVNDPSSSVSGEKLSDWLPAELCEGYFQKGVRRLYQWQVDCLRLDGVLDGKSLVYCASTSAGKSLVAEILMLKRVVATGKMAMLVLPYVALCSEKTEHLEAVLEHVVSVDILGLTGVKRYLQILHLQFVPELTRTGGCPN